MITETYNCPYCNKEYSKMGIATHIWRSHGSGKSHNPNKGYIDNNRKVWNKNETKFTNKCILKQSETLKHNIEIGKIVPGFTNKKHTLKSKRIISKKLSKNNKGGRSKWYKFYKSNGHIVKVQGTWEYRFAKVLEFIDEDWIKIKREPDHLYEWVDVDNITHNYTPDFYSPKLDKYFEVKGYWWGNDEQKMKYVQTQYNNKIFDIIRNTELLKYEKKFNLHITKEELNNHKI
jgi:hypothetical protein